MDANIAFTYVSESSAEKATALEKKLIASGVKAKAYQAMPAILQHAKLW